MFHVKYILFSLLLVSCLASAQQLRILTEHLAPFQIVKDNNEVDGFSTDVVREVLNRSGHSYVIEAYPWTYSYKQALNKNNTCVYSLAYTQERKEKFQWIGEIARSTISFYSLKSKNVVLNSFEEARHYNVAVIKDDVTHHFMLSKGFVEEKNLYVMGNYDALLKLLEIRKNSIDLVILNDDLLKHRVHSLDEENKYQKHIVIEELELIFNLACNLKTPTDITKSLSKAMIEMKADGSYQKIKQKWQSQFSDKL